MYTLCFVLFCKSKHIMESNMKPATIKSTWNLAPKQYCCNTVISSRFVYLIFLFFKIYIKNHPKITGQIYIRLEHSFVRVHPPISGPPMQLKFFIRISRTGLAGNSMNHVPGKLSIIISFSTHWLPTNLGAKKELYFLTRFILFGTRGSTN